MKKILFLLLALVLCLGLVACGISAQDELDSQYRSIEEGKSTYEHAKREADQFKEDVEEYRRLLDEIDALR